MKIIWICNMLFPEAATLIGTKTEVIGGWLLGLSNALNEKDNINITICTTTTLVNKLTYLKGEKNNYFLIPNFGDALKCSNNVYSDFKKIFKEIDPDLIHIHGTEYAHSLEAVKACENKYKYVISIQGLTSTCALHYLEQIPYNVQKRWTLRDLIKRDNLLMQKKSFEARGKNEIQCLKKANHIIGRTNWDKGSSKLINKNRKYYFCNEILRDSFYCDENWELNKCNKHTIFFSQAYYPIKGLHIMLKALSIVKESYPDVELRIAGSDIFSIKTFKNKIFYSSYTKYIRDLIRELNLEKNITFIGNIEEVEMKEEFLKANIFVCSSLVENESNSVSEAKILGVPVISSYVGGVAERITHYEDGLLFPVDEHYMLAYYIMELFKDDELAVKISKNAIETSHRTNNKKINVENLVDIYKTIIDE